MACWCAVSGQPCTSICSQRTHMLPANKHAGITQAHRLLLAAQPGPSFGDVILSLRHHTPNGAASIPCICGREFRAEIRRSAGLIALFRQPPRRTCAAELSRGLLAHSQGRCEGQGSVTSLAMWAASGRQGLRCQQPSPLPQLRSPACAALCCLLPWNCTCEPLGSPPPPPSHPGPAFAVAHTTPSVFGPPHAQQR